MTQLNPARELSRLLLVIVSIIAIAVLFVAKVVLLPLAFAMLFAFLLAPLVTLLERICLPRVLAILLVILGFGAVLGLMGWTISTQLIEVADHLPAYRTNIAEKIALVHKPKSTAFGRAATSLKELSQQIGFPDAVSPAISKSSSDRSLGSSADRPLHVQEVSLSSGSLDAAGGVLKPLLTAFLTVVFTFFMLLQREDLRNRFIRLTGHGHLNLMTQAMDDASRRISRYFLLQLMVNTAYGLIAYAALQLIRLPHAALFGALATVLRFIPYIGAPSAALLPTALSLAVFRGWTPALLIVGIFFCLEVITANYVEPRLYGKHTGLSSLAILVAAAFWTLIWGPVGLVLSVPLTVCLVVVGRHVPNLEFLTVLLGDQPVMLPSAHYYQRLLANDEHEAADVLDTYLKDHTVTDLYDLVLIPALRLSEQDRHQSDLDEATIRFIYQTTRELVEDLALRDNLELEAKERAGNEQDAQGHAGELRVPIAGQTSARPVKALCVPVRDEADELVARMLAQLLERAGCQALVVPIARLDTLLELVSVEKPAVVVLSGLPPFALARARRVYRMLRIRQAGLKIMIGLWSYAEDASKAAMEISRGEEDHIVTTLAEAVEQMRTRPIENVHVPLPDAAVLAK